MSSVSCFCVIFQSFLSKCKISRRFLPKTRKRHQNSGRNLVWQEILSNIKQFSARIGIQNQPPKLFLRASSGRILVLPVASQKLQIFAMFGGKFPKRRTCCEVEGRWENFTEIEMHNFVPFR